MSTLITYEVTAGTATITLNRPESYNALTTSLLDELNGRLREAVSDGDVYVIVLTGAGDGFCAGVDMEEVPGWEDLTREEYEAFLRNYQHAVRQLYSSSKPTIAAVDGATVGGGCALALSCDVRFFGERAYLRPSFTRLGIAPADGSAWLLAQEIGESRTRRYLLPGDDIDATTAVDLGLAVDVVSDPLESSREFAADLVSLPARAVKETNDLVGFKGDLEAYFSAAIEAQWTCVTDPEHAEAVSALRENREPAFDRPKK